MWHDLLYLSSLFVKKRTRDFCFNKSCIPAPLEDTTKPAFTCSQSIMETPERRVKFFIVNDKDTKTT